MLFSHPEVSTFVNDNLLAAWESLRPVPTATIDFGDGRVVERTMNGNIATYVCTPSGHVIDVIAGLVSPELYLEKLRRAVDLAGRLVLPAFEVPAWHRARMVELRTAHIERQAQPPSANVASAARPNALLRLPSKSTIELPTRIAFALEPALLEIEDAEAREFRDQLVHSFLTAALVEPSAITKRIYRDVLHVDLSDPWLGLAIDVFDGGGYPRAE